MRVLLIRAIETPLDLSHPTSTLAVIYLSEPKHQACYSTLGSRIGTVPTAYYAAQTLRKPSPYFKFCSPAIIAEFLQDQSRTMICAVEIAIHMETISAACLTNLMDNTRLG